MPHQLNEMPFGDHLEELRRRLIFALMGPVPIMIVALFFGGPLLSFLVEPAEQALRDAGLPAKLLATSPVEPFVAYLKVALIVGVAVSAPWILYQAWLFVAPGLYKHEKKFAHLLFPLSGVLTIAGLSFLYTVLLPVMLRFLIAFNLSLAPVQTPASPMPEGIDLPSVPVLRADPETPPEGSMWVNGTTNEVRIAVVGPSGRARVMSIPLTTGEGLISQQYRVSEYVSLCFALGLVFAVAFQLPVVMLLGGWVGVFDVRALRKLRRYAAFACAITAAVATPADPASMVLLAIPLYLLFELGLLLMRAFPPSRETMTSDEGV